MDVNHNGGSYEGMPLVVLKGSGANLGRDWLEVIQLQWQTVINSEVNFSIYLYFINQTSDPFDNYYTAHPFFRRTILPYK